MKQHISVAKLGTSSAHAMSAPGCTMHNMTPLPTANPRGLVQTQVTLYILMGKVPLATC